MDGLSLDDVREKLEIVYSTHAASGCLSRLNFAVDRMTGVPLLAARCHACGLLEFVI